MSREIVASPVVEVDGCAIETDSGPDDPNDGDSTVLLPDDEPCPWCEGKGYYTAHYKDAYLGRTPYERSCEQCWGHGTVHPSLINPARRKKK